MCGIVGYVGDKQATEFLLEGLSKLEYRGYDSAGIAVYNDGKIRVEKSVGRLAALRDKIKDNVPQGTTGIGHTRWATHGRPSDANSHPHTDCSGDFVVVHNGIIENYLTLKEDLIEKGHAFKSETDTEVVAHLLEEIYNGDFVSSVREVLRRIEGAYSLVFMSSKHPGMLIAAKQDLEGIRRFIGADSLGYLSIEGMFRAVGDDRRKYCDACFSGNYRLGQPSCPMRCGSVRCNQPRSNGR